MSPSKQKQTRLKVVPPMTLEPKVAEFLKQEDDRRAARVRIYDAIASRRGEWL